MDGCVPSQDAPPPEEAQNTLRYRRVPFMDIRYYLKENQMYKKMDKTILNDHQYRLPVSFSVLFAVPYTRMIQGI